MESLNFEQFTSKMLEGSNIANEYILASPLWVQIWVAVMILVMLPSFVLSLKHSEARWVAWSLVILSIWTPILMLAAGPSRLWGITHLCFWTPVMIVALAAVKRNGIGDTYHKWLATVGGIMAISIAFDIFDVIRFISGEV